MSESNGAAADDDRFGSFARSAFAVSAAAVGGSVGASAGPVGLVGGALAGLSFAYDAMDVVAARHDSERSVSGGFVGVRLAGAAVTAAAGAATGAGAAGIALWGAVGYGLSSHSDRVRRLRPGAPDSEPLAGDAAVSTDEGEEGEGREPDRGVGEAVDVETGVEETGRDAEIEGVEDLDERLPTDAGREGSANDGVSPGDQ